MMTETEGLTVAMSEDQARIAQLERELSSAYDECLRLEQTLGGAQSDLATALERVAELDQNLSDAKEYLGAISFALHGIHPCKTDNKNIDELVTKALTLRRALDADKRLLRWAQERLEFWIEHTDNSLLWDDDAPEDAEQMNQDRRALAAIKSALGGDPTAPREAVDPDEVYGANA